MSRVSGNQLSSLDRWDREATIDSNHSGMGMTGNALACSLRCGLSCRIPNCRVSVRSGNRQTATPQHLKPLVFFKGIDERYALLNTVAHK
jgi:hypothetical protein